MSLPLFEVGSQQSCGLPARIPLAGAEPIEEFRQFMVMYLGLSNTTEICLYPFIASMLMPVCNFRLREYTAAKPKEILEATWKSQGG